jgi:hypothetical protein
LGEVVPYCDVSAVNGKVELCKFSNNLSVSHIFYKYDIIVFKDRKRNESHVGTWVGYRKGTKLLEAFMLNPRYESILSGDKTVLFDLTKKLLMEQVSSFFKGEEAKCITDFHIDGDTEFKNIVLDYH